jgi:hypothetical protein
MAAILTNSLIERNESLILPNADMTTKKI